MTRKSLLARLGAPGAGMLLAATAAAQADRLIKEMSAYIGSANEFTFHADVTFDRCAATFNTALISVRPT